MVDLRPFVPRLELAIRATPTLIENPSEAFRSELSQAGFTPPKVIHSGQLQRIAGPGDKGHKTSGWCYYVELTPDEHGYVTGLGSYGSWKGIPEKVSWVSKQTQHMTHFERNEYSKKISDAVAAQELHRQEVQREATVRAYEIWKAASEGNGHPYLTRKGVKAYKDVRVSGDRLLIPVTHKGALVSLQYIWPDGGKKFLTGGRKKGCYYRIEGHETTVRIAEGYATGATLFEATGDTVYVAFDAGNIYEVAAQAKDDYPSARIVICADNDQWTAGNPGRMKAQQAAEGLGLEVVWPEFTDTANKPTDFNDLVALEGAAALKKALSPKSVSVYQPKAIAPATDSLKPTGVIANIIDYYNATSGNKQPDFAVQCAIATCSVILARNYETNFGNRASLYLINIGKSGTGKEHAKTVMEKILAAGGLERLVSGDGYTSGGAVFSALQDKPRHITVIDEFSKYLQAAQNKNSSGQMAEANSQLMQAYNRLNGVMRPKSYSTMGLTNERKKDLKNLHVKNPGITLLAMTTPDDFFETIGMSHVKDGFLNRFIVCISDAKREVRKHKEALPVPDSIKEWITAVENRHGQGLDDPNIEPIPMGLTLSLEALAMQEAFQIECIDLADQMEKFGLAEMPGRANEMALRLSLIVALSRDWAADMITGDDIAWAISWVRGCMIRLIEKIKMSVSASEFEGMKLECLAAIRARGEMGVSEKELQIQKPFSKWRERDRKEILQALLTGEQIEWSERKTGKVGRPGMAWVAVG